MKRTITCLLLLLCLLATLAEPCFATQEPTPPENTQPTEEVYITEEATLAAVEETTEAGELPATEESSEAQELPEAEKAAERNPQGLTVSEQGLAFLNTLPGAWNCNVATAETYVNDFSARTGMTLSQQQFDALADIALAYGNIFAENYSWWRVMVAGSYTDAQLATSFCAWVKGADGEISDELLLRRLREVKLFLYGSYDGNCSVTFRYVKYHANGGVLNDNSVLCYTTQQPYGALPTAAYSGKYFAGWYLTNGSGTHLIDTDIVAEHKDVYARWSDVEIANPNGPEPRPPAPTLKMSEEGVQFIKNHEGFVKYAMWDVSQYSIGYGTRCEKDEFPNGITEEEADYRLRFMLADFEKVVDNLLAKGTVQHTQAQYDAILSFTFNLGQQWMKSNYLVYQYFLYGGCSELELLNTMGSWLSPIISLTNGLARRRMDEANLYYNGDYSGGTTRYVRLVFDANGGICGEKSITYRYYLSGTRTADLPTPTYEGYRFTGWYTAKSDGTQYTIDSTTPNGGNTTLYAHWVQDDNPPDPPIVDPPIVDPPIVDPPIKEPDFTDVPKDAWYAEYVIAATKSGLFTGISDTLFAPNSTTTRAMLVTVLWRAAGKPTVVCAMPFTDVAADKWYTEAIRWAFNSNIVKGISSTEFGVSGDITREQLTTMLYRYAEWKKYDVTLRGDLLSFSDHSSISDYALEPLQWAVAGGIVSGADGKLSPKGSATRAQCAKMVLVLLENETD